jgi:hypothetical protein
MERDYLLTAVQGKGILIMDNDHQELSVVASPKEHSIITTNPNEKIAHKPNKKETSQPEEKEDINIKIDIDRDVIHGDEIEDHHKNYLGNHGFVQETFVPIGKTKQEEFWIKTSEAEGTAHIFLTDQIKKAFLKTGAKVESSKTKEADIIIKYKNLKPIAIEVETGSQWKKNYKNFQTKFAELKKKYGNNLFIVLTDSDYKQRYINNLPTATVLLRKDIPILVAKLKKKSQKKNKK